MQEQYFLGVLFIMIILFALSLYPENKFVSVE